MFALLLLPLLIFAGPVTVTNAGFETGDFTGWTQSCNTSFTWVSSSSAHTGTYSGRFGPVASTSSTELKLGFRNDPDLLNVDDIGVNETLSVPEPSTLWLFGAGAALLRLRRRK